MEPSLPRVADSALMRLWRAKEKVLASLGQPPVWGGCSQGGFTQDHRLLPFTLRSSMVGTQAALCFLYLAACHQSWSGLRGGAAATLE